MGVGRFDQTISDILAISDISDRKVPELKNYRASISLDYLLCFTIVAAVHLD